MRFWRNVFILAAIGLLLSIIATIARAETYLPRGFGDTSRRERIMQTTDNLRVGDIRSSGSLSLDSFLDMPKTYIYADGNISTSGTVTASSFVGVETWPENVITVGAENCDYTTVQAAITAASSGDVVLVMPGTYNEQITGKAGVTVRGVSRDASIIRYDVQFSSPYGPEDSSISWGGSGTFSLENLTLQNLTDPPVSPGGAATVLYTYNAAILRVRDCNITGSDNDTVSGWGTSQTYIDRCRIEMTNSQPDPLYFGGSSTCTITNCDMIGPSNLIYTADGAVTISAYDNRLYNYAGIWTTRGSGTTYNASGNVFVGASYIIPESQTHEEDLTLEKNLGVAGDIACSDTVRGQTAQFDSGTFGNASFGSDALQDITFVGYGGNNCIWNTGDEFTLPGWTLGGDTTLYRSAANTLKTDDTLEAAYFKGDGSQLTNLPGGGSATTPTLQQVCNQGNITTTDMATSGTLRAQTAVQSEATRWKDWPAASYGIGLQYLDSGDYADDSIVAVAGRTWRAGTGNATTHIETTVGGATALYPIHYESGTVLTRLRVKWQAVGTGDGVKVRLVRRDDSGTATAWTVVGAQQTYTDAGSPYDVTVSTYDFADETMAADNSYAIEVESVFSSVGVSVYAVGVETSKRVF